MPLSRIKLLPIDPAGFETAEPSWDWWDIDPGIKIVLAHLQAQGPSAAPSDVKRLKADANGNLLVSTAGAAAVGPVAVAFGGNSAFLWERVANTGDGNAGAVFGGATPMIFNGVQYDRARSAGITNLAAQSGAGAALMTPPGEWSTNHAPGAGVAASAVRAAGGAGVRHIGRRVSFVMSSQAALAGVATVVINIRDGASGAGAIMEQFNIDLPAAIVAPFQLLLTGLNLVGTAATAMTAEMGAAVAGLRASVSIAGYDAI